MDLSDELARFEGVDGLVVNNEQLEKLLMYLAPKDERSIALRAMSAGGRTDPEIGQFTQLRMMSMITNLIPEVDAPWMCEPARLFLKNNLLSLNACGAVVAKTLGPGGIVDNLDAATSPPEQSVKSRCEELGVYLEFVQGFGPFAHLCPVMIRMFRWRCRSLQNRLCGVQWRALWIMACACLEVEGTSLLGALGGYVTLMEAATRGLDLCDTFCETIRLARPMVLGNKLERLARLCGLRAALSTVGPYVDFDPVDAALIQAVGDINYSLNTYPDALFVEVEARLEQRVVAAYRLLGLGVYLDEHLLDRYERVVESQTFPPLSVVERFLTDPDMELEYSITVEEESRRRNTIPCRYEDLHLLCE